MKFNFPPMHKLSISGFFRYSEIISSVLPHSWTSLPNLFHPQYSMKESPSSINVRKSSPHKFHKWSIDKCGPISFVHLSKPLPWPTNHLMDSNGYQLISAYWLQSSLIQSHQISHSKEKPFIIDDDHWINQLIFIAS